MAFIAETADTDVYTGPDTSTPWKRTKRGQFRYLHGYLLVVARVRVSNAIEMPRVVRDVTRWEATVENNPAPARTEGWHVRMSAAKEACEDYVQRSCVKCRRAGYLMDLAGKEYRCDGCDGMGVHRG